MWKTEGTKKVRQSQFSKKSLLLLKEYVPCANLLQSCLALCDPMDCSPPGSSVHGISQARILEWVAFPSPEDLPNPGIEPASLTSPHWQGCSLPLEPPGEPFKRRRKCLAADSQDSTGSHTMSKRRVVSSLAFSNEKCPSFRRKSVN